MSEKHLIRPKLVNLEEEHEYDRMIEANRSMVDEFLSDFLKVHILEITPNEMRNGGVSPYGRDNMTEVGNVLFANPSLSRTIGEKILGKPSKALDLVLSELGYRRKIVGLDGGPYDGGKFILGEKFGLISDFWKISPRFWKFVRLGIPTYTVSQVSTLFSPGMYHDYGDNISIDTNPSGHIDCRFNIVDEARIIYVAMGSRPGSIKEGSNQLKEASFRELQRAAKAHGYEIRDYFVEEEKMTEAARQPDFVAAENKFGVEYVGGHIINGVNFITFGKFIFTSIMGEREKEYLESKDLQVVEVPLKFAYYGAGLRCVYGEITI